MQWEYKVIEIKPRTKHFFSSQVDLQPFELLLNEMGRSNWELVQCDFANLNSFVSQTVKAVFKRAK
ncbi:DUF4177 domain-containing protein [Neptunicella sp. SCSIO 80796]|uniref:DUF4177 domain-containing protein n=1 Tax=Neptunicella plasticusilytica TaxID=3117012 RepID=UPI003A4DBB21